AILLSWLMLGEPVGLRTAGLAGMVLAGVALLIWAQGRGRRPAAVEAGVARGQELSEAAWPPGLPGRRCSSRRELSCTVDGQLRPNGPLRQVKSCDSPRGPSRQSPCARPCRPG